MPGPPPKPAGERRRYNQPARSEWVDLAPLQAPVLPPWSRKWSVSQRMWQGWRSSPVTSQYGPEDIEAIVYLGRCFEELGESSRFAMMDRLGLTPKGKRDLRWRTPQEVKTIAEQPPVKRLRLAEQERKAS